MPTTHDRVLTLCREIAHWLRAVAMDEDETLTAEERRALIEVALEVERKARLGRVLSPEQHDEIGRTLRLSSRGGQVDGPNAGVPGPLPPRHPGPAIREVLKTMTQEERDALRGVLERQVARKAAV